MGSAMAGLDARYVPRASLDVHGQGERAALCPFFIHSHVHTPNDIRCDVADVFLAVADPLRRRILEFLRGGARSANDLVAHVNIAQRGVSRHLRILQDAGIYSLRREPLRELDVWVRRYRQAVERRLDRRSKIVRK